MVDLSCGVYHTCVITEGGALWATGANSFGQLGIGSKKGTTVPVRVPAVGQVKMKKVSCGHHTAAISVDGELYLWGTGVFGEVLSPKKVTVEGRLKDVAVGGCVGLALGQNGKLWTWGSNSAGELGLGDYEPRTAPHFLDRLDTKTVVSVSCGGSFAIALGVTHTVNTSNTTRPLEKMDSVATQVLSNVPQGSPESADSACDKDEGKEELRNLGLPSVPTLRSSHNDPELLAPLNPKALLGDNVQGFGTQHPDQPPEGRSVSDINTAEIFSSVSQRDPHQPVRTFQRRRERSCWLC